MATQDQRSNLRKKKLLSAAVLIFAEERFEQASVRRICSKAGANVSAVTYHFGGKRGLYTAAIDHAASELFSALPPPLPDPNESPEESLRALVRWAVRFTIEGGPTRTALTRILLREMREPNDSLDAIFRERARPMVDHLCGLVARVAQTRRATIDPIRLGLCVLLLATQYEHSAHFLGNMGYPAPRTLEDKHALADMIVAMALGGLAAPPHGASR
jgi:AcrR family transcriptional regulator